jgi:SH3-like domain-containing protein
MRDRLFFVVVFLSLAVSAYADVQGFPFVAEVNQDNVNIRAGQSENFERIYRLNKGDSVVVTGKEYSWYKVKLPQDVKLYVSSKYVTLLDDFNGEITGDKVNVRSGPSVEKTIMAQLKAGDKVAIVEKGTEWHTLKSIDGASGWVNEKFIVYVTNDFSSYREVPAPSHDLPAESPSIKITAQETRVKISGLLQPSHDDSASYILHADKVYKLQGMNGMLNRFLNYQVEVEGDLADSGDSQQKLKISSIQLVF